MKSSIFVVIILVATHCYVDALKITMEQMKQATEPVRMICIDKSKVSEASLLNMRAGKLDENREFKCYVNCVMEMLQLVGVYN
jgi:hypothetical protein